MRKKRLGSILISAALIVILAVFLINLKEGSSRAPADAVALSEIMISNKGSVPDNLGGYPDYIELHNGSTEKADISGYGLSDSLLEGCSLIESPCPHISKQITGRLLLMASKTTCGVPSAMLVKKKISAFCMSS